MSNIIDLSDDSTLSVSYANDIQNIKTSLVIKDGDGHELGTIIVTRLRHKATMAALALIVEEQFSKSSEVLDKTFTMYDAKTGIAEISFE